MSEKNSGKRVWEVRHRLNLDLRTFARVLACTEKSLRAWEKGREPEGLYGALLNWVSLQLAAATHDDAAAWSERIVLALERESPMGALRELLITPNRARLMLDGEREARDLEYFSGRSAANELRAKTLETLGGLAASMAQNRTQLREHAEARVSNLLASEAFQALHADESQRARARNVLEDPQQLEALLALGDSPLLLIAKMRDKLAKAKKKRGRRASR